MNDEVFLAGYGDKLSARPGDIVNFCVSVREEQPVSAKLFRCVSSDPNPDGPGVIEEPADVYFSELNFDGVHQDFFPGSFGFSKAALFGEAKCDRSVAFKFFPTLLGKAEQYIFSWSALSVSIDSRGHLLLKWNGAVVLTSSCRVLLRTWYSCHVRLTKNGELSVALVRLNDMYREIQKKSGDWCNYELSGKVFIASKRQPPQRTGFFNGKVEALEIQCSGKPIGLWDFSKGIDSFLIPAITGPDIKLQNSPTRGVCGSLWDGSEFNWRNKPSHYAAVHFHEDDIYDFGWKTSFSFKIPEEIKSGIYFMRIFSGDYFDAIPLFITPPRGKRTADLCILVPTFTYVVYGNHARPDFDASWSKNKKNDDEYPYNPAAYKRYGLSTYNMHRDGSGICFASHRRPIFNMRPGFKTFGKSTCSGLRHLQADTHLLSWLNKKGIEYDIVTDDVLNDEGVSILSGYKAVSTTTHPEYHTFETLNALKSYRDDGGALVYLGGNGFYWRVALNKEDSGLIEIRRSEDGLRAWASEPGEYYYAFDGKYGGLWRRLGRPPQKLVGVGFTAQANFVGMPFERVCFDQEFDWVFEGINQKIIGNYGLSGGGAAGFELDRIDNHLDDGQNITVLAQSYDTKNQFVLVPEELLTHITNLSGQPQEEVKRADMVYFETPKGGRVFSVGSITFCGCLPVNNFENDISTLLSNVLRRFGISPKM